MRDNFPGRQQHPPAIANRDATPAIEYIMDPQPEEPRFRDYWKMLVKRRRLIMVILLIAFGIGVFIALRSTPLYTASATLRIEPPTLPVMGKEAGGDVSAASASGDDYFRTQVALLKSRALAARVIKNLTVERNPNFVVSRNPIDQLRDWVIGSVETFFTAVVDSLKIAPPQDKASPSAGKADLGVHPRYISRYLHFLTVEDVPKTELVKISFTTIDPSLSQELANAHATAFIRMNLETRFELTKEAREFLEKRLAELKVKVGQSEEALNRFWKAHGVVSLEGNDNVIVDRMVDLNRRLTEARAKRIELESLAKIVKDKNYASLTQIIDNNMIVQLRGRLETLEAEQARLATIFTSNHPRLVELDQQVGQARQRLNLEIRNVVRSIESDYAAARAREAALQAEADRQGQAALNLKELGVQHTLLQGELDANRSIYASVLRRLNETSVSTDSPLTNIQIVDPAEMPLGPSSPQTERTLLLASVLGLFCGVGLALLLEHSTSAMRTPEEVWRTLAVPTLGMVPHWRSLRRREYAYDRLPKNSPLRHLANASVGGDHALSRTLIASQHPFSLISESYRTIRSSLLLTQMEQPLRVVLLTSARPGEGKTSVTLNLALTLAQSGRRVVIVDADLRAGNCHRMLGLTNRRGLADVLSNGLTLEESLQRTAVDGLFFIARGAIPPYPADLLGSGTMQEVLQTLRERFDLVLIDSPPAIAVSDAEILSVQCDGVCLVLRAQKTPAEAVQRMVERLEMVGAKILGTVLVGVDFRNPDYADHRYYYTSYYAATHKRTKEQS
jgi:polysaccharide biosynthesis transport protein